MANVGPVQLQRAMPQRTIWMPEVILEEDEEVDDEVFSSPGASGASPSSQQPSPDPTATIQELSSLPPFEPPTSPHPADPQNNQLVLLQVPPQTYPTMPREQPAESPRRRKRSRSMRKLVKTLKFMKKWARAKNQEDDDVSYDAYVKKEYTKKGDHIVRVQANDTYFRAWLKRTFPLDPSENFVYCWLGLVSCFFLYNVFLLIGRETFDKLNDAAFPFWVTLDYISDVVYLLDIVVEFMTGYLAHNGMLEKSYKKIARRYVYSRYFWMDLFAVLPTDFFYLIPSFGPSRVFVRLNRMAKPHKLLRFVHRTESHTNFPNLVRIGILIIYITMLIHWNACIYFLISEHIGFGNDTWVYPSLFTEDGNETEFAPLTRQYLFSFYWSTLTLTTIGELPAPTTDWEYFFVISDFMVGVLVFATIVGMVGAIISNMNLRRLEFQRKLDNIKHYMRYRSVGKNLQLRVIKWFDYLWTNRHTFDEDEVLQTLPDKLRAEISIHVHFDTLRRVKIFEECEAALLEELVLKLKPQVFSPGDFVCRKGDIGKEMYIVKQGILEVLAEDGKILTILTDGGHFGEISILNLSGCGNRRTAHVRSVGYSELFSLSKTDLLEALVEYPEAREALEARGRRTLMNDKSLTRRERVNSLSYEMKGRGKPTTAMQLLSERMNMLEQSLDIVQSKFAKLIGEYSTTQIRLKKRVRLLEAQLRATAPGAGEDEATPAADFSDGEEQPPVQEEV